MKTLLFAAAMCAAKLCAAQSLSLVSGGGIGLLNSKWNDAAPIVCAGLLADDPIGERAGIVYGLAYKQRAAKSADTRLHVVQFDVSGRYTLGRFDISAGGFFALAAGTRSDQVDGIASIRYSSGVCVTGAVGFRLSDRLALRVVYDHGFTDMLPEFVGNTTAQSGVLCLVWRAK